jgi:hypothetical protein
MPRSLISCFGTSSGSRQLIGCSAQAPLKTGVSLLGSVDGVNTVFTTPDKFTHDGVSDEMVYLRGLRLRSGAGNDYTVSESGGAGTGYDTITFASAPRSGDNLFIDYFSVLN